MKATELTDKTAEHIVSLLVNGATSSCCASVLMRGYWEYRSEMCYAPVSHFVQANGPDHFGISFWGTASEDKRNAYRYLCALMSEKGPFKDVLLHLHYRKPKDVWNHRGFVFKDMTKAKVPGLIWTFMQASRMIWEHPAILPIFVEARKHSRDPVVALYAALALRERNGEYSTDRGEFHGEALGSTRCNPIRFRKPFLQGLVEANGSATNHGPWHSYDCFPTTEPAYDYRNPPRPIVKSLPVWIKEFEELRVK